VADEVEHEGGATRPTARNGPIARDGHDLLLGTTAQISDDLRRSSQ
jgi:hypothetical protein